MDKKVSRKAIEYLKERKEDFIPLIYKGFRELKNKIINRLLYSETENRPLFHISLISEPGNINLEKLGLNERQKTHEKSQLAT